jgi:hypothetical protein
MSICWAVSPGIFHTLYVVIQMSIKILMNENSEKIFPMVRFIRDLHLGILGA